MLTVVAQETLGERDYQSSSVPANSQSRPEPTTLLLNRELSLLRFQERVLEEALDQSNPLLERLKFLSIFASNIDEFFMIRVSGLKEQVEDGVLDLSPDGMTAAQQLVEIRAAVLPMIARQVSCLSNEILPQLRSAGIEVASYDSLNSADSDS